MPSDSTKCGQLGLDCPRIAIPRCQALKLDEGADAVDVIDAQHEAVQFGCPAGLGYPDGGPESHEYGGVMHGLAVGHFGLVLQARLLVLGRLFEGEVVSAAYGTQSQERNAALTVAKLPAERRAGLVILKDRRWPKTWKTRPGPTQLNTA